MSDYAMAEAMVTLGGGFVSRLGELWQVGDDDNRARLLAAWPEYCAEYRELARLKRARLQRKKVST